MADTLVSSTSSSNNSCAVLSSNGTAALDYARRGLHVFPLWWIEDGKCACAGRPGCSPGKHPIQRNGLLAAIVDLDKIAEWWNRWPDANVAIATGEISGIVVVDVDGPEGERSAAMYGLSPDGTMSVRTGNGFHLYYRYPDFPVKNSVRKIAPGLDIRGDGGYVVAPPSVHQSGRVYEWSDR